MFQYRLALCFKQYLHAPQHPTFHLPVFFHFAGFQTLPHILIPEYKTELTLRDYMDTSMWIIYLVSFSNVHNLLSCGRVHSREGLPWDRVHKFIVDKQLENKIHEELTTMETKHKKCITQFINTNQTTQGMHIHFIQ